MTPEIQKVPDLTKPPLLSLTNSTSSIPELPHLLPKRESSTPQLLPQKLQTNTLSLNPESKNDKSLELRLFKPSHLLQNKRPKVTANPPEPTISSEIFQSKPLKQTGKIEVLPSSERLQQEFNIKRVPHVDVVVEPISVKRKEFKPRKNSDKSDLPSETNSIIFTSSSPKPIWYNEPVDPSKNVTDQSKTSKKRRFEMTANTTEPTMNPGMSKNKPEKNSEKYQTEENSKEPQNVINSQSTTVKPILLNSYFITPIPSNEPADPSKNVAEPSKASEEQGPATTSKRYKSTTNFNNPIMTTSSQLVFDSESTDAVSLEIAKPVADFKNLQSLSDYENAQLVSSDNQQPVVHSSISPPVVDSEDSQPVFDSGIPQPVVNSSSPQPAVDFISPQFVVDSETHNLSCSGTPHPPRNSSIPTLETIWSNPTTCS
jgi:hypothetical protein